MEASQRKSSELRQHQSANTTQKTTLKRFNISGQTENNEPNTKWINREELMSPPHVYHSGYNEQLLIFHKTWRVVKKTRDSSGTPDDITQPRPNQTHRLHRIHMCVCLHRISLMTKTNILFWWKWVCVTTLTGEADVQTESEWTQHDVQHVYLGNKRNWWMLKKGIGLF